MLQLVRMVLEDSAGSGMVLGDGAGSVDGVGGWCR